MKYFLALCLWLCGWTTTILAQDKTGAEKQIDQWNDKAAIAHDREDFAAARTYADSAMAYATRQGYRYGVAQASFNLSQLFYFGPQADLDSVIFYMQRCYEIARAENFTGLVLASMQNLCTLYNRQGDHTRSLNLAFELLDKAAGLADDSLRRENTYLGYSGITRVYMSLEDYPNALKYIKIAKEEGLPEQHLGRVLGTEAYINTELGNYREAYQQALAAHPLLAQHIADPYDTIATLYVAGRAAYHLKLTEESRHLLLRALSASRQLGDMYYIVYTLNILGEIALDQNHPAQARAYFVEAVAKGRAGRIRAETVKAYLGLHKAYRALGQPDKALDYHLQYTALKDSLFNETKNHQLAELATQYETAQKEREIVQKNALLKQQETERNALAAGLGMLLVIVVVVYRAQRQKTRANRELAEKNKQIREVEELKARWFANVAHELKTPLTLIDGPLGKVLDGEPLNEVVKSDLTLARRNTQKLSDLIFEILEVSKIEENKLTLREKPTSLTTLVKQAVSYFDSSAREDGIRLRTEIESDFVMRIDEVKLHKVLTNFISNALKFTPAGGEVVVRLYQDAEHVILAVKDNGAGISKEDQQHIFDRFFQSKDPAKARQGGTGIGLSIAKEIALLHGAQITLASEPGQGCEISFRLPLDRKAAVAAGEAAPAHAEKVTNTLPAELRVSDKPTLLLVEDNRDMRQYISSFMKHHYHIIACKDGLDALAELARVTPDLIISDLMMPRMDGMELARKLKAHNDWQHIPFITLTAIAAETNRLKALRIGVDDYLAKPFSREELIVRSNNLLRNAGRRKQLAGAEDIRSHDEKLLKLLYKEVADHISSSLLKVSVLADKAAMSERQLQRYLKKHTGLSPNQFIREIKLQKALVLLEQRAYPTVAEVGHAVGFVRMSHFSALFENRFGKKPGRYL